METMSIEEKRSAALAKCLCEHYGVKLSLIECQHYISADDLEPQILTYDKWEFVVVTDDEAQNMAKEGVQDVLCLIDENLLAKHIAENNQQFMVKTLKGIISECGNGANPLIWEAIKRKGWFMYDVIAAYGRKTFVRRSNIEHKIKLTNGVTMYVYTSEEE